MTTKNTLALDFKSATLYTLRVVLQDHDSKALIAALDQRMTDAGTFFEDETVVVDATALSHSTDWQALVQALRQHRLHPVGVVAEGDNLAGALEQGLPAVDLSAPVARPRSPETPADEAPVAITPTQAHNPPSPATNAQPSPAPSPASMVVSRPLRSGQRVYAKDTDLIVIGMVSQGAEVIADGNIHVYGPLRGKAMAGARGDETARIFTTQLDPELLAIAGVYRVIETDLDKTLHDRAALVQRDGDSLKIRALN